MAAQAIKVAKFALGMATRESQRCGKRTENNSGVKLEATPSWRRFWNGPFRDLYPIILKNR
jgi:hypothetical protein